MDSSDDDIIFSTGGDSDVISEEERAQVGATGNSLRELESEGVSIVGDETFSETQESNHPQGNDQDLFKEEGIEILSGEEE